MRLSSLLGFFLPVSLASMLSVNLPSLCQEQASGSPASKGIGLLEAVRSTLELHPLLHLQEKQVEISRALRQQAGGDFDTQLQWSAGHSRTNLPLIDSERLSALQAGIDTYNQAANLTTLSGSAQRLLRSGIVIGPRIDMNRTTDNVQSRDGVNLTRLSFEVNIPLWRGKGREVVTARETSAQLDVDASLYDLNETIAELILSTATSYWQYVSSVKQLEILTGSEARGKEFVESVQALINADKLPRNEINQVQANFAGRSAARISLEQQVAAARHNLTLAMGMSASQLMDLPMPSDSFPDGEREIPPSISSDSIRSHIEQALRLRADFLAAEKKKEAANLLRKTSRNSLLPRLDLTLSTGYAGLQEGRRPDELLISPFTNTHGPDILFGLRYSFPLANNLAHGQVAEAEASYQQTVLLSAEKARNIGSSVASTLMAVYNGIHQLKLAREAVTGFQAALEGEKDKLRLGVGSLTDLLTVESRLTDALLALVYAQESYAIKLVQYRFASGTLIAPDKAVQSVDRELFFSPQPKGPSTQ